MSDTSDTSETQSENNHVTVYATSWCGYCRRLKEGLASSGTPYTLIDIEEPGNEEAAEWVMSVNDGNAVVPTVRYSDGSHATNPPAQAVDAKFQELSA
ncbi:mycoredoxin [Corynebacterium lubricantis]|uniref:mycoredoxin n=1 Tax=Corynebacterium lubricantis TaxID=541095 RepID=UPI000381E2A1|nr:mycoredoxin [Corynebacterium lubricantis]